MSKSPKKESFETALKELEELVQELEGGEKGLAQSLELFEKGVTLAKTLAQQLEEAKRKVEVLTKDKGNLVRKAWEES